MGVYRTVVEAGGQTPPSTFLWALWLELRLSGTYRMSLYALSHLAGPCIFSLRWALMLPKLTLNTLYLRMTLSLLITQPRPPECFRIAGVDHHTPCVLLGLNKLKASCVLCRNSNNGALSPALRLFSFLSICFIWVPGCQAAGGNVRGRSRAGIGSFSLHVGLTEYAQITALPAGMLTH